MLFRSRRLLRLNRADRLGTGTQERTLVEAETQEAESMLEAQLAADACFSLKQLAVSGRDLLALGMPQGRALGDVLETLLQQVISGNLTNTKAELCQYAQKMLEKKNTN